MNVGVRDQHAPPPDMSLTSGTGMRVSAPYPQIWYYNRYFTAYKEFDEIPYEGHLASHSDQALRRASTTPLPTELPFYYSMPVIRSVRGGGLHHVYNALTHSLSPINEHEAAHAAALRRRASL